MKALFVRPGEMLGLYADGSTSALVPAYDGRCPVLVVALTRRVSSDLCCGCWRIACRHSALVLAGTRLLTVCPTDLFPLDPGPARHTYSP